jgi:hypothetical protein
MQDILDRESPVITSPDGDSSERKIARKRKILFLLII